MPLPQYGPYEALEGIYPSRARETGGGKGVHLIDLAYVFQYSCINFNSFSQAI
jgi:hypothetical protein